MMWNGNGMGGWGIGMMLLSNLVFWAVLFGGGFLLYRTIRHDQNHGASRTKAEQVLRERYARGEVDDDEYERRLTTLRR